MHGYDGGVKLKVRDVEMALVMVVTGIVLVIILLTMGPSIVHSFLKAVHAV